MNSLMTTLQQRAASTPEDTVLEGLNTPVSAHELYERIKLTANYLRESNAKTIALFADNNIDWIVVDLACQFAEITLVPLATFFSVSQVEHVLTSAAVELLLYDAAQQHKLLNHGEKIGLEITGVDNFLARNIKSLKKTTMPLGTNKITFTSGSTGQPKGVCLSTQQCLRVAQSLVEIIPCFKPKHLCLLPLSTLLENIGGIYMPLLAGGTITVVPSSTLGLTGSSSLDSNRLIKAIEKYQPNTMILVPQLLAALDHALSLGWKPPSSLKFVAVGGARVSPTTLARAHKSGLPVYEGYGLSESASVVALNNPANNRPGSSGKPLGHVDVKIKNGEVFVSGNSFLGYLNQIDSWGRSSVATGDMGAIDSDGYLTITGRIKNQIITSYGRNINPEWIETELLAHQQIQQAIVVGDARPSCMALIYPRDQGMSDQQIQQTINLTNQQLPDYAQIAYWLRMDAPLSPQNHLLTENGRPRRDLIESRYVEKINQCYKPLMESVLL